MALRCPQCTITKMIPNIGSTYSTTVYSASYLCFQTMSNKEKGKFEDLARQDKARYEREMMSYVPARGGKKKKYKDPNAPKRPP